MPAELPPRASGEIVSALLSRRVILGVLLTGLLVLGYTVLHLFLVPVAWAGILAYVTWPFYARLRRALRGFGGLSAGIMTLALMTAFALPLLWLVVLLRDELTSAYTAVAAWLAHGPISLPKFLHAIPWLGEPLQTALDQLSADPAAVRARIGQWAAQRNADLFDAFGGVGRNAAKLGFALVTVFFLYRDGERLVAQIQRVLHRVLGSRIDDYLSAVGNTTRAVVYGLGLTAIAQGVLAGLGYWVAGVSAPALLGALTALISLIPFGTPLVWGSIGVWLLLNGKVAAGAGLLLWGALVVSWVDNLIRPLVISSATEIPFLLVMFGALGGLAAFGLVGLFLGPVIVAILMAVWREWAEDTRASAPDIEPPFSGAAER